MRTARKTTLLSLLVVCCLVVFGCSKKEEAASPADPGTSVSKAAEKAATEAGKMDVKQLRAAVLECKAAVDAKIAEGEKAALSLMQAMGDDNEGKRKELKAQMDELKKSEDALAEQLKIYVAKLKEKGGDLSGLE